MELRSVSIRTGQLFLVLFFMLADLYTIDAQPLTFVSPMEGVAGEDYYIVNYVDHDTVTGSMQDGYCGNKTYDNHQGTDFVISSFKRMDEGVAIFAVADGKVFIIKDSLYDRNKESVISRGFGNYIGINHRDSLYTYYAHLKAYSLLVKAGDSVKAGQQIASVGCSGNCTDPHLHLEVWTNTENVDPFSGASSCGSGQSLWQNEPLYDTTLKVIDQGYVFYHPGLDTLRERYRVKDSLNDVFQDTTITFWVQLQGIRQGDSSQIEWYTPRGALWFRYNFDHTYDAWYYYWWSYIDIGIMEQGWWHTRYYVNNELVTTDSFYQDLAFIPPSAGPEYQPQRITLWTTGNDIHTRLPEEANATAISASVMDIQGREIFRSPGRSMGGGQYRFRLTQPLAPGIYACRIVVGGKLYYGKVMIE